MWPPSPVVYLETLPHAPTLPISFFPTKWVRLLSRLTEEGQKQSSEVGVRPVVHTHQCALGSLGGFVKIWMARPISDILTHKACQQTEGSAF